MREAKSPELIAEHTERLTQLKALMGCGRCDNRNPDALKWYPESATNYWTPERSLGDDDWSMIMYATYGCQVRCSACRQKDLDADKLAKHIQDRWEAEVKRNPRGRR
jgi:hypothetical protein